MTDSIQQLDLFPSPPPAHDPGGKVRLRLPADVRGDATFSACMRHRPLLRRWRGEVFPSDYILFIGMNPSTAEGDVDDPTIAREWDFSVREGYAGYVKANVGDYRATSPKALLAEGVVVSSERNHRLIVEAASAAGKVVLCHGKLNKVLAPWGRALVASLGEAGIDLHCFGTNNDGSPKHPLYLSKTTPLVPFLGGRR